MAIVAIVGQLFYIYELAMLLRILMSWLEATGSLRHSPFVRTIHNLTDPFFIPARILYCRMLGAFGVEPHHLPFDFSPILAFAAFRLLHEIVLRFLLLIFGPWS